MATNTAHHHQQQQQQQPATQRWQWCRVCRKIGMLDSVGLLNCTTADGDGHLCRACVFRVAFLVGLESGDRTQDIPGCIFCCPHDIEIHDNHDDLTSPPRLGPRPLGGVFDPFAFMAGLEQPRQWEEAEDEEDHGGNAEPGDASHEADDIDGGGGDNDTTGQPSFGPGSGPADGRSDPFAVAAEPEQKQQQQQEEEDMRRGNAGAEDASSSSSPPSSSCSSSNDGHVDDDDGTREQVMNDFMGSGSWVEPPRFRSSFSFSSSAAADDGRARQQLWDEATARAPAQDPSPSSPVSVAEAQDPSSSSPFSRSFKNNGVDDDYERAGEWQ